MSGNESSHARSAVYPAMSHPVCDPAMTAASALLAGLETRHPSGARILEIGCGSGLNLIALADRWPGSRFTGIDLSDEAIRLASSLADAAGLKNITFHARDLRDLTEADGEFDYILAHGVFSWVPDEAKLALLDRCRRLLAPNGLATVSFNVECGWLPRFPVIEKTRAIQQAGNVSVIDALAVLRTVTEPDSKEMAIIDDLLAKGPKVLMFDDFAPVNDPWSLASFVTAAGDAGLRWLGESDPAMNLPRSLDEEAFNRLRAEFPDPLSFHMAVDEACGRTFRSGMLCRAEAPIEGKVSLERVFELNLRCVGEPSDPEDLAIYGLFSAGMLPACAAMREIRLAVKGYPPRDLARRIYDGIYQGWLKPRVEPVSFNADAPELPKLNRLRLECAKRGLPVVDIWQLPCSFAERHLEVLAAMDGTRDAKSLAAFAKQHCPELAFEPWLRHLAGRGMFA